MEDFETMRRFSVMLFTLVASSLPVQQARAQEPERIQLPIVVGAELMVGQPVGEFADYVGTGFGAALQGLIRLDRNGIIALRAEGGFLNYGNETKEVCFSTTVGCRVKLDLTTSNNIAIFNLGPQLELPIGPVRPFANAAIGFAYFATTSGVRGADSATSDFAQTTNFSDATFAWSAGGGLKIPIWISGYEAGINLGARYHGNGRAEYLRKGDIQDNPDGTITITPNRSEANLVTYQLGFSVRLAQQP
jgi:hypothetical protein